MMRAMLRLLLAGLTASAWLFVVEGETPLFAQACNPNYSGTCIPAGVTDADCAGGTGDGPHFVQERNVRVVGNDQFGLDADNDGFGCDEPTTQATSPTAPGATTPTAQSGTTATTVRAATTATAAPLPNTGTETQRQAMAAMSFVLLGIALLIGGNSIREKLRME